jgi:hypothetical protein
MSKDQIPKKSVKKANLDLKIPFSSKKKESRLNKLRSLNDKLVLGSQNIDTKSMKKRHPNLSFSRT